MAHRMMELFGCNETQTLVPNIKECYGSLQLWSNSKSFNTIANVASYIGVSSVNAETDFQIIDVANQI